MKIKLNLLMNFLVLIFLFSTSLSSQAAKIKCWTNNEGIRECGTTIPPEFAQQSHQEINSQGRIVKEQERAKTEKEIDEEKRLAAIELENKKAEQEGIRKDKILLDIYAKVEDIEKARDDNIKVIKSRITLTMKRIEKTQADLDKRIQSAAAAERAGKEPNEALLKDIETLQKRIKNNGTFITERQEEIENVRASYNADIERFKELKQM